MAVFRKNRKVTKREREKERGLDTHKYICNNNTCYYDSLLGVSNAKTSIGILYFLKAQKVI